METLANSGLGSKECSSILHMPVQYVTDVMAMLGYKYLLSESVKINMIGETEQHLPRQLIHVVGAAER